MIHVYVLINLIRLIFILKTIERFNKIVLRVFSIFLLLFFSIEPTAKVLMDKTTKIPHARIFFELVLFH